MKRFLAGALALVLFLAGCSGAQPGGSSGGGAAPTDEKPAAEQKTPAEEKPAPKATLARLTVGFVPSQEASAISDKVKPMSDFLSQELGIPVETFVGTNFVAVVEGMGSQQVDVGFLNPLSYVMANADYDAQVILKSVRRGSEAYRAQLTVRAGEKIPICDPAKDKSCKETFEALKGKKLAFVDPASTSGYLFPASFMMGAGVNVEKGEWFSDVIFAGQHDTAVKGVLNKTVDASWTFEDVRDNLEEEVPDVKEQLVAAAYTDWIPNDTVSVRQGLDGALVAKIKDALLKFAGTEKGKKVLQDLYSIDGFAEARDADYRVVKEMAANMGLDIRAELTRPK